MYNEEMRIIGFVLFSDGVPVRKDGRFVIFWDIRLALEEYALDPGLTIETFWGTGERI